MPKVSICIPTYNNLSAFKRCLGSVLKQGYGDYEVIITDDSTNDDIYNYLRTLRFSDNIIYKKNETQLGSPENWNEAMRNAKGEYIKILHHDDFFTYNNSLQIFVNLLENNPEVDFAFVASRNVNTQKNQLININNPDEFMINKINKNPLELINGNYIGAPSATIFRKNKDIFFDKKTIWLVDLDFYIRILKKNPKLEYINIDAISIGISNLQLTNKLENDKKINLFEYFYLLDKYNIRKITNSPFENHILNLLKKFKIYSIKQIRKTGFDGKLPNDTRIVLFHLVLYQLKSFFKLNDHH